MLVSLLNVKRDMLNYDNGKLNTFFYEWYCPMFQTNIRLFLNYMIFGQNTFDNMFGYNYRLKYLDLCQCNVMWFYVNLPLK